jgi:hypothetical protein
MEARARVPGMKVFDIKVLVTNTLLIVIRGTEVDDYGTLGVIIPGTHPLVPKVYRHFVSVLLELK